MALMDETTCDTSCEESDESSSDGSESKRTIKDDDWTSGDDYEPLRKITRSGDSGDRIRMIYSSDSSEEDEELIYELENLSWHPITGRYMKHFPYEGTGTGVSKEAIADLAGKAPYDFFKYLMTDDVIEYVAEKTNAFALRESGKESLPAKSRLTKWKEVSSVEMEKFLVRLFKLCSDDGYVYDLRLHQGNRVKSNAQISSSIVLSLMKNLLDRGRILYTDAYSTSIPLAHRLLRRSTHLVGTLGNDVRSNPKEAVRAKLAKDEEVSMESNTGIIVFKWKHKADDLALSTVSHDNPGKRDATIDRKNSMSLVERLSRSKRYSGRSRRGTKWYQRLAAELTTGAALTNAFILYRAIAGAKIKLTQFKEEVATRLLRLDEKAGDLPTSPVNPTAGCELRSMGSARRRCTVCYERLKNEHGREYASARCKQSAYKCIQESLETVLVARLIAVRRGGVVSTIGSAPLVFLRTSGWTKKHRIATYTCASAWRSATGDGRYGDSIDSSSRYATMPANKTNQSTPHKERSSNGLTAGAAKKKKRSCVKHKRHCKQYLT
ncbi:hypothetical protein KM043_000441 [Ampulex compressa]|nr:hypothetical protein KM043_000441 [Ampulex compressa]